MHSGKYPDVVYSSVPQYTTYTTYQTSSSSPYRAQDAYFTSAQPTTSRHARRATMDGAYDYGSSREQAYHYSSADVQSKPQRRSSHRHRDKSSKRHHSRHDKTETFVYTDASGNLRYATSSTAQSAPYGYAANAFGDEEGSAYDRKYRTSPPPERTYERYSYSDPSPRYEQYYQTEHIRHSRKHREETKTRTKRSHSYAQPRRPSTYEARAEQTFGTTTREATSADARRAQIPAGFSLKHWDPTEEPILLLGSVFDANSLGKWIYDWAVACHGVSTPLTEMAGDLWLLLIQLSGKMKRAEEKVGGVRDSEDKELIEDFIDSGERLWKKFSKLLKVCEAYMLKAAKKSSSSKKVIVGKDSGYQFIKCIFGRDKELEHTEKVMTGVRLWSMRFDANCDDILRYA